MAHVIEKSQTDDITEDIPKSLKFVYNSRESGTNFIDDLIEIEGIEKSVFDLFVSKHTLLKMLYNKLLDGNFIRKIWDQLETIDAKVYNVEKKIEEGKYVTNKLGCYLWIHSNNKFTGVYYGVPDDLLETVLNPIQTFICSLCGQKEEVNMIPDIYYNNKTHECYCNKCFKNSDKLWSSDIKHL